MLYKFSEYKPTEIKRDHLKLGQTRADGASFQVNSRYIEKDGKPWIGIMGEYHFVRDSHDRWKQELLKMKAGGINTVASYVFWIYHEEIEGEYDFSADRNLRVLYVLGTVTDKSGFKSKCRRGPSWGLRNLSSATLPTSRRSRTPNYCNSPLLFPLKFG